MLRYLDASVVIDGTDSSSPLYTRLAPVLRSLPVDEVGMSELVRLECLIQPKRTGDHARTVLLEAFLGRLVDLQIDRAVYDLAIDLRATHKGLKTPDALHLATALHHGCGEFWTNDLDLAKRPVGLAFRTF